MQAIGIGSTWAQASGVDYALRRLFGEHGADHVLPASFVFDKWWEPGPEGLRPGSSVITALTGALSALHVELGRNALVAA